MTKTYELDANGFPIQTCGRCGGCGRYSFNLRDLDRCYGCGGTGKRHPRKVEAIVTDYTATLRRLRYTVGQELKPGERVAVRGDDGKLYWQTVESVEVTDHCVLTSWAGAGDNKRITGQVFEAIVTYANGQTVNHWAEQVRRHVTRKDIDIAEYAARARAAVGMK